MKPLPIEDDFQEVVDRSSKVPLTNINTSIR